MWIDGQSSSSGRNNRVALGQAGQLRHSLRLIPVNRLRLEVHRPGADFGNQKRRLEAEFELARTQYRLRVTDPVYERRYFAIGEGEYELGECCLTISLGEPYEGFAYKLVAAVIERTQTDGP